jgi:signal recognition particle subunit SRP68
MQKLVYPLWKLSSLRDLSVADKKIAIFDKQKIAYHNAWSCIHNNLAYASKGEDIRDDLNGLDKAVSVVLDWGLISIDKSKFTKHRDEKMSKSRSQKNIFGYMICLFRM